MRRLIASAVLVLVPVLAQAGMPSDAAIKAVADAYLMKKPAPGFGVTLTMAEAAAVQERYDAFLARKLGAVVGYKAGLTNPAVQKRLIMTSRSGAHSLPK